MQQQNPASTQENQDLVRVAKKVHFDINAIFENRGGFWIVEYQDGRIGWLHGAPTGFEETPYKSSHYYEDVLNMRKQLGLEA